MSIKKSFLEKNLFYRVAKVYFLTLPLLVAATLFLKGYINIQDILQKNILDILQKNIVYIVYVVIGLVLYFLILKGIWRGFLYIAYGGLEDDTKKRGGEVARSVDPAIQPTPVQDNGLGLLFLIIFIILIIYIATYTGTPQKSQYNNSGNKTSQCIPTGCGTLWRSSCTNLCYANLSDCRQTSRSGCSSVICRQCP